MAQPERSQIHVDKILTNISVAYIQDASVFVAPRVFPVVPVDKQSDKYYTYDKNDWFRDEAERRAPATESAGGGYELGTDSYSCDVWAFHKDVPDQDRQNADNPINLDREATEFITQRLLLRQEVQWVADYFTTSVWADDVVGGTDFTVWSDYATSDPIEDIGLGRETILSTTGFEPNKLTIGWQVWRKLKRHPDILDMVDGMVTPAALASVFELDDVVVAKAIKATNIEGETAAYAFTHGKHALLTYSPAAPGLMVPAAGYIFAWRGVSQPFGQTIGVARFPMRHLKADRVEGEVAFDDKVVATDMGYFFSGAVS